MHPIRVQVHKIQSCFMVCIAESVNPTDANTTVLLHFELMLQTCLFAVWAESVISW